MNNTIAPETLLNLSGGSCISVENAIKRIQQVREWIKGYYGEVEYCDLEMLKFVYEDTMRQGQEHNQKTGKRCNVELIPELIGMEGCIVDHTKPDGQKQRYKVGKSTGWMPCHLAMSKRGRGGIPVWFPKGSKVVKVP